MFLFLFNFSKAGDRELRIVQIIAMFIVATISTVVAILVDTVYGIFILTADIVYVIVFPQFVCAVFIPFTNTYGSFFGFIVGIILRFGGGEPSLNLQPFIKYPFYDGEQLFPYKTFAMLCSFLTVLLVSFLAKVLFEKGIIPPNWDISRRVLPNMEVTTRNDESSADVGLSMKHRTVDDIGRSNVGYMDDSNVHLAKF